MSERIAERVQQVITEDQGILQTFGLEVVEAWDGTCIMRSTVPAHLVNASGFAHGAIVYALMDTASAYALGSAQLRGVTIQGDVKYVRGGKAGTVFEATVTIVSQTSKLATLRGEVHTLEDDQRTLAAYGSYVFQLRS